MSEHEAEPSEPAAEAYALPRRRWLRRVLAGFGLVLILALAVVWLARERIANSIIAGKLEDLGLPGSYEIESIGPRRQILRNVVIGDPRHPDMTIARATVSFEPRFGIPVLGKVRLEQARLYGTYRHGKLSFGRLDPVIFAPKAKEGVQGLPDLDVALVDARARLDGDFGIVGFKAEGRGNMRSDFAGTIAAFAPQLNFGDCRLGQATAFGRIKSAAGGIAFAGPLRLNDLACADQSLRLRSATLELDAATDKTFGNAKGSFAVAARQSLWGSMGADMLAGKGRFSYAARNLVASYRLNGGGVRLGGAGVGALAAEGTVRSRDHLARIEGEGKLRASELRGGPALIGNLASVERSAEGSLIEPLARQMRDALLREERGSRFSADFSMHQAGAVTQLMLPTAELTGGSGARLIALNRFALVLDMKGGPRFSGRFVMGGADLPQIEGTAQSQAGGMEARLRMAEYRAGTSAIALPDLRIVQLPRGEIGFAGRVVLSGPMPGGDMRALNVPIDGTWSQRSGLALWRGCTPVAFESLTIGSLKLSKRGLTLCPGRAGAIVRSDRRGLRIAAGTAGVNLTGTIGATPIRLRSGAIGAAWPGALALRNLDVSMGPVDKPSTIKVAAFTGQLGKVITGRFSGTEAKLFAVPLDITKAEAQLRFADSVLDLSGASLTVSDRVTPSRFNTLVGRDAKLRLANNVITAQAMLREPKSDREIVLTDIVHNLTSATGHADLAFPGVVFDSKLQPDTISYYASGVIALAKGTLTGTGRIDWNAKGVTSTGKFSSDGLDFAAAFGPVKGARGTVVFTDLLGMVTAPDQRLQIASINPGIEVFDGILSFQIEPNRLLVVNGAEWPFIDGALKLLPTRMVLGNAEVRRFTLKLEEANAAKFVQQLDLANISATGIFDGTVPLVFDEQGGRIDNGLLISRPPGGNISYVGELTYKDLSAMGNFAFQTLRSLDFTRMEIGINGKIDGDIVTNMRFEGVRQGPGAKQNFITRQLGKLPIRFNVNIRAPFYQLVTSFKSLYDSAYVRDPRSLGLVGANGKPVPPPGTPVSPDPENLPTEKPNGLPQPLQPSQKSEHIQDSDSRNSP